MKAPLDPEIRIGDRTVTVVERASTAQTQVGHVCVVTAYCGDDPRVEVEPICGARGGLTSSVDPIRVCARCAARITPTAPIPLVWEPVETASTEPDRYIPIQEAG